MGEPAILAGVRVIDLARNRAGSVAAMLLAEAGADVVKVEPPGGIGNRGTADFAVWNRSKRSIVLDIFNDDRGAFERLIAASQVLLHDYAPPDARRLGLDSATLGRRFHHLIPCSISGFPDGHVDEQIPAEDILVLAASGLLDEQPASNRDGPAYLRFPLGSWGAAWLGATGIVAQILARARGRATSGVATSLLQGALLPGAMLWHDAERDQQSLDAGNARNKRPSMFECADGVWLHLMHHPDETPLMQQFLGNLGAQGVADANRAAGPQRKFANYGANIAAFKSLSSARWLAELWAHDVPVQPALPMGAIYDDEQAAANGYIVAVDDPVLGPTRQPGPAFSVTPPAQVRSPAPTLDQDRAAILGWSAESTGTVQHGGEPGLPLKGVRVIDFGIFLAGPLACMLLGDLGADVIKIESPGGDPMRGNPAAFTGCQRNKRALAINLKDPRACAIVKRLVAGADVVHHNLRLPAAERLGIGYETLRAINPRLIYSHVSSYGPVGPRKDWPGYDQLFQAQCGWEIAGAGEGNAPMWHRFGMMDHQCALASLYATLLGLIRREATGKGSCVAASLLGASLMTVSEAIRLADGALTPLPRLDAAQMGISPGQRLYQCRDGWIAVGIEDCLAPDQEQIEHLSSAAAIAVVAEQGGLAVPVRANQAQPFLRSSANGALGLVAEYPHAHHGTLRQPGAFWTFAGASPSFRYAPPLVGEQGRAILEELGYSTAETRDLVDSGVVSLTNA